MTKIPRGQTPERKAYMKAYCESHPKRDRRAYKAAYDAAHGEQNSAYRAANAERIKEQRKAFYLANRERCLAKIKAYTAANYAQVMAYHARYAKENRDKVNAWGATTTARRRARLAGSGGSHTLAERLEKFATLGNVCFYCHEPGKLSIDHDIPIARGGTDNIDNILPACLPCNRRKHKRTSAEYLQIIRGPIAAGLPADQNCGSVPCGQS